MESTDKKIIAFSLTSFVLLILISVFLVKEFALSINLIFIGMIIVTVPYSIYKFMEFKKIRAYEKEFPGLLRDLAESQRAGLSILQAVKIASKSEYGRLTDEVKKINNQLSWNIPLETVLHNFSRRMKKSKIIVRSLMIIEQANKSGSSVEDTMDSLASNIELIRDVQDEKNTLLNQQVIMMYAIFFIFLGITISLIKFLVPLIQTPSLSGTGDLGVIKSFSLNPCQPCIGGGGGGECAGCYAFSVVSAAFGFGGMDSPAAYYRSLFFMMIAVQGFFSGLIAGQIGSDSVVAGVKHSLIMLFSGILIFMIVVKTGIV